MPDFYAVSERTDYPFLAGFNRAFQGSAETFPDSGILDFGIIYGPGIDYSLVSNKTYLISVVKTAADVTFTFSSDADDVVPVAFTVALSAEFNTTTRVEITDYADAFLVTGKLDDFSSLPDDTYIPEDGFIEVEPVTVQSLKNSMLISVELGNEQRALPPFCCEDLVPGHADYPFVEGFARDLQYEASSTTSSSSSGGGGIYSFPDDVITDFGADYDFDTGYDKDTNKTYLRQFTKDESHYVFTFSSDEAGSMDFIFAVPLSTTPMTTVSDAVPEYGAAFIVVGDLSGLAGFPIGTYTFSQPANVEYSTVTVDAANNFTKIYSPDGQVVFPAAGEESIVFKPGYNCELNLDERTNTLTINSRVGSGAGRTPADSILINNGKDIYGDPRPETPQKCGDYISSINGVEATSGNFRISAGAGLEVVIDEDNPNEFELKVLRSEFCGNRPST